MNHGIKNLPRNGRAKGQLLVVATCAVVTVLGIGAVQAQEDDGLEDRSFERKIIDNIMRGFGAVGPNDTGIDYRERSPLVVPPTTDLPPPETAPRTNASNWPKDPDIAKRKAEIAARKKQGPMRETEDDRLGPTRNNSANNPDQRTLANAPRNTAGTVPVDQQDPLSPSQLGAKKSLFGNLFTLGKPEAKEFEGEPNRSSLVQPPPGYQTPARGQAYGMGKGQVDEFQREMEMEKRRQAGDPSAK